MLETFAERQAQEIYALKVHFGVDMDSWFQETIEGQTALGLTDADRDGSESR